MELRKHAIVGPVRSMYVCIYERERERKRERKESETSHGKIFEA